MDKMIITQTFTMARWQIVVKTSEATKRTKDQNINKNNNKNKTKTNKNHTKFQHFYWSFSSDTIAVKGLTDAVHKIANVKGCYSVRLFPAPEAHSSIFYRRCQ